MSEIRTFSDGNVEFEMTPLHDEIIGRWGYDEITANEMIVHWANEALFEGRSPEEILEDEGIDSSYYVENLYRIMDIIA